MFFCDTPYFSFDTDPSQDRCRGSALWQAHWELLYYGLTEELAETLAPPAPPLLFSGGKEQLRTAA